MEGLYACRRLRIIGVLRIWEIYSGSVRDVWAIGIVEQCWHLKG